MAHDLTSLLSGGVILDQQSAKSRKSILGTMSKALGVKLGLEGQDILEAVLEREKLGSTAVGDGVVVPHARIEGIERPVGAFVKLDEGLDFDAPDGHPCDLVFMLLAPHVSGADHLRALAQVSRTFRNDALREKLRQAITTNDLQTLLCPSADVAVDAA